MSDPNWEILAEKTIPAQPEHGNWTLAFDYIDSTSRLKFVAEDKIDDPAGTPGQSTKIENKWNYAGDKKCSADGDPKAPINPANCLVPDAPAGALVAKIGGSIAGRTDGPRFIIGSQCVIELAEPTKGPLYLTMNVDPMGSLQRAGQIKLTIYHSK